MTNYEKKHLAALWDMARAAIQTFVDAHPNTREGQDSAVSEILKMFPDVDAHHVPDEDAEITFIGDKETFVPTALH